MAIESYIQLFGPLFEAVVKGAIFSDAKTFVDATPKTDPKVVIESYDRERMLPDFDLKAFVTEHFILPKTVEYTAPKTSNMREYIKEMWPILLREMDSPSPYSTLISLPKPHIVPGGRFRECFYWDSYFSAIGLIQCGEERLVKDMVENFASLIDRFGFIPNGNRLYFTSRSQPPYFSHLLTLLCEIGEEEFALSYFPQLKREYRYWMDHSNSLALNHYFDSLNTPRPEAYKRETALAERATNPEFFRNLRAACASGWDFSSRWLEDSKRFETIWALDILPIDLNCLLYHMEETLGRTSNRFKEAAERRKGAIQTLFWNGEFFFDYHLPSQKLSSIYSLAAATPLFVKACTQEQADLVAKKLEREFLLDGGFVTSLTEGDHQWDMPNGWAPLQWITIQGLLNYGHRELALEGAKRWLALNEKIFAEEGTLLEKYNVRECSADVARGEYALQEGFAWTNGVALALMALLE
ncbi:MAG: Periplasmic trehalase [Chlamydiae bacterium]|nr:Periplasmic trehalase [Chlamydiota bacterium]